MADIFLSYARKDRKRAEVLAKAREGVGWSVFWDLTIPAGLTWDEYIGGELEKARCVVVAWSAAAVKSDWVREEAREGRKRKILVPAFFEVLEPPFGFRGLQGPDLSTWRAEPEAPDFRMLVHGIERHLGTAPTPPAKKLPPAAKKPARKKPTGKKKAPAKKPASRRPAEEKAPAAAAPSVSEAARVADAKRGENAPTWKEDEKLNRRILIEGGEFLMGSPEGTGSARERPQHRARLSPFHLQEHAVTIEEYRRFKFEHKDATDKDRHPMVFVSWDDATAYAKWLGGRLPTETEWEFACRAGTQTAYWSGDSEDDLTRVGWYGANSGGRTHPVAEKPANPWGLYDMHGNVWEWVADWFADQEYKRRARGVGRARVVENPPGPPWGERRVFRGGGFADDAEWARAAVRSSGAPRGGSGSLGFRVAFPVSAGDTGS